MLVTQAFDGSLIADIAVDSADALNRKLELAAQAFRERSAWLHPDQRLEILRRLATLVYRDAESLAMMIVREGGKPLTDARVEVARAINSIECAVSALATLHGNEIPMGLTQASRDRWAFTTHEPIGVVAAISAFNHPLNLVVHQVVPAIATGCPVVIKPAQPTPLTCLHFVKLVREAGLPEPWCQTFITDELELAERFATDPRVAFLSFIGSARVGWYLRSRLPPGTRSALEHGGSAPVIIDQSADLNGLIEPLVKGSFYHAGQVCVSVQRVFVHKSLSEELIARFSLRVSSLRVGDPTLPDTEVGPLIHPRETDRVARWVEEAKSSHAKVAAGGMKVSHHVYAPTILRDPAPTVQVSLQEVFGPVVCVYEYTDLLDVLTRANSLPTAFQAAVFTQNLDVALYAARFLDASSVMINDHTAFRTDWMPFAGRRQSGYGVGGIAYTMRDLTQSKMIVVRLPS